MPAVYVLQRAGFDIIQGKKKRNEFFTFRDIKNSIIQFNSSFL
jgi:hypothetical protein